MAKQTVNPGVAPTGVGGDTFRSGSAKLQANDDEIYAQLGATAQGVLPAALPVTKGGTGAATVAAARTNLGLGTAAAATLTTSAMDNTLNRVLKVGDFGIGERAGGIDKEANYAGNLFIGAGSLQVTPFPMTASILHVNNFAGFSAQLAFSLTGDAVCGRKYFGSSWQPYFTFKTSSNTTIDSNGFIKNASPIVQLSADKIELNDEAAEQDITFEKIGIGHYLVKGSSGFSNDGWYIEMPKDANGNVLVAVVYEQLENKDISIQTYAKKFDEETGDIVANLAKPRDIPESRWIDIRLNELPKPEFEQTTEVIADEPE